MQLDEIRKEINQVDDQLKELFLKRMVLVKKVIEYKIQNNLEIYDASREAKIYHRLLEGVEENMQQHYYNFIKFCIEESKDYQKEILLNK